MAAFQTFVGFGGLGQWILGERHFQSRFFRCGLQARELARASLAVVSTDSNVPALFWRGFDAVRVRDASARSNVIEELFELATAGKDQRGIDAVGCSGFELFAGVLASLINHPIRSELPNQAGCVKA